MASSAFPSSDAMSKPSGSAETGAALARRRSSSARLRATAAIQAIGDPLAPSKSPARSQMRA